MAVAFSACANQKGNDAVSELGLNSEPKAATQHTVEINSAVCSGLDFEDKTEYEIAKEENATQQSVHIGLERAKEKLKEILKNFKF